MPAGKREALAFDVPFENWTYLDMMYSDPVHEIYEINMPYLEYIYLYTNGATNFPAQSLKHVETIYITGGNFGYIDTNILESVTSLNLYNCNLSSLSCEYKWQLQSLGVSGNTNMTWLSVYGCYNLNYIYASNCNLSAAAIESLVMDLYYSGVQNGYLRLTGGTNSPPNSNTLNYINILTSRGWRVYTN